MQKVLDGRGGCVRVTFAADDDVGRMGAGHARAWHARLTGRQLAERWAWGAAWATAAYIAAYPWLANGRHVAGAPSQVDWKSVPAADWSAWFSVAQVLLNLDETITKN